MKQYIQIQNPQGAAKDKWPKDFSRNCTNSFRIYTVDKNESTVLTWNSNKKHWENKGATLTYADISNFRRLQPSI